MKIPWGQIALGVSLVVMVELLLLLAVGSYIKRGNEQQSLARARTNYVNSMTACTDRNDGITEANKRTLSSRELRTVVVNFAAQARDARLADGDDNIAAEYERERRAADSLAFDYTGHITCTINVKRPSGTSFSDLPREVQRKALYITAAASPIPPPIPAPPKEVP